MNQDKPDNTKQKVAAGLVALVVIALLAGGVIVYGNNQSSRNATATTATIPSASSTNTATTAANSSTTATANSASSSTSGYKDGMYTASSDYYVPHGSESIKVTLTVKGGVVTDSTIQNSENNGESAQYQQDCAYQYQSLVVGKSVSSLQLSYVAGASDTTQGFNDAVQQIRSQAQA